METLYSLALEERKYGISEDLKSKQEILIERLIALITPGPYFKFEGLDEVFEFSDTQQNQLQGVQYLYIAYFLQIIDSKIFDDPQTFEESQVHLGSNYLRNSRFYIELYRNFNGHQNLQNLVHHRNYKNSFLRKIRTLKYVNESNSLRKELEDYGETLSTFISCSIDHLTICEILGMEFEKHNIPQLYEEPFERTTIEGKGIGRISQFYAVSSFQLLYLHDIPSYKYDLDHLENSNITSSVICKDVNKFFHLFNTLVEQGVIDIDQYNLDIIVFHLMRSNKFPRERLLNSDEEEKQITQLSRFEFLTSPRSLNPPTFQVRNSKKFKSLLCKSLKILQEKGILIGSKRSVSRLFSRIFEVDGLNFKSIEKVLNTPIKTENDEDMRFLVSVLS